MASSKTRQRKLERQRYERKLVRMAQKQRRKRRAAAVGAFLTLLVLGSGAAWLAGAFDSFFDDPEPAASDRCTWLPRDPAENPDRTDVGTPPSNPATTGSRTLTVDLDAGDSGSGTVEVAVDVAADPCAAASMEYLASQGFFDGTTCHELAEEAALRCGDPSGTGLGGPAYSFFGENVPFAPPPPTGEAEPEAETEPLYPAGTVALADTGGDNSSQFLIFYQDYSPEQPVYPLLGTVTSGLDVVQEIGEAGGSEEQPTTPVNEVLIQSLTVADSGEALQ